MEYSTAKFDVNVADPLRIFQKSPSTLGVRVISLGICHSTTAYRVPKSLLKSSHTIQS